jgi:acyl-CoA thioester hydrolase
MIGIPIRMLLSMKPNPRRFNLEIYPHRLELQARFADIDPQWHLNNVRIAEFYQEGRVSFNHALRMEYDIEREPGHRTLVARQSIDYLAEAEWPGGIIVAAGISRIGGASFSMALALFQKGKCVGISDATLVFATKTGPTRLPDRLREVLANKLLPEDARD